MLLYSSAEARTKYGRVVELVDSLDSGSSVHCGRAGSSPASPTKEKHRNRKISVLFLTFWVHLPTSFYVAFTLGQQKGQQIVCFDKH